MAADSNSPTTSGDQTDSIIAAAVSSMIISTTFFSLRIAARIISRSFMLWSDIFLFGGVIACVVISSIDLHALKLGLGRQIAFVATEDPQLGRVVTMLKFLMVNNCAYAFGQVTVKISLCLMYRSLFTSQKLHRIIDITIAYSVLWGIAFIGVAIFSCRPVHAFWDFSLQALPTTYCVNNRAWYLGQAVPNILTDILVLAMPIKQVLALKLNTRSKLGLVCVFALGLFVCIISVIRVVSLFAIDNQNPTWTLVGIANWSSVEFAIAVMCGSLPTLRPLIRWVIPNTYAPQPRPILADETIGGGGHGRRLRGKRDHYARMHGISTMGNDSFQMNDMETLVGTSHTLKDTDTFSEPLSSENC